MNCPYSMGASHFLFSDIIKNGVGSILPNRQHLKICKIRRTLVSIDNANNNKMKLSMQLQGLESQKRQIMKANKSIAR
jgi:hypothetical protein